jgi:hypothetical protein
LLSLGGNIDLHIVGTHAGLFAVVKGFIKVEDQHLFPEVFRCNFEMHLATRDDCLVWKFHLLAVSEDFEGDGEVFEGSLV